MQAHTIGAPRPADTPSQTPPPIASPTSAARLAANRANAAHSTGPRTALGKARSASNSLQHGFYSLQHFQNFVHDNDIALAVVQNCLEQFLPVTPYEHILVQQIIQLELRFLQVQFLYGQAMAFRVEDLLNKPSPLLSLIVHELDRIPNRMHKAVQILRQEQQRRDENTKIEPIADHPPLPALPDSAYYDVVITPNGPVAVEKLAAIEKSETKPTPAKDPSVLTGEELFQVFAKAVLDRCDELPAQPEAPQQKK